MTTDYIIIGAGVYGAATAWWLAQRGAEVLLLDEREVATRASGGPGRRGVRANARDVRELPLMREGYEVWPDLHEQLGVPQFYERTGHLLLAETELQMERARAMAWMQRQQGIETEILEREALLEREPGLSPAMVGALYCPLDGVSEQAATTRAYAAAAAGLGVAVRTGCRVSQVETAGGRVVAVATADGERLTAERGILVLANPAVPCLIAPWLTLPIWSECLQIVMSRPLAELPFRHLTGHLGRTVSLKTEGPDRVMVSGGWHGIWNPGIEEGEAVPEAVEGNVREAAAVYPALAGMAVERAEASHLESFAVDGIPIIDDVDGVDGLWYATGWCGHGWAIAPVVARLLASWALDGKRPAALAPFGIGRFG